MIVRIMAAAALQLILLGAGVPPAAGQGGNAATPADQIKVLFIGDSIVEGEGDDEKQAGFVGRLSHFLPELEVASVCRAGATSAHLLALLQQELLSAACSQVKEAARGADLVVVMAGAP